MRILVAEDDAFSRRFLTKTLQKWGYEVLAVCDGLKAMEALQQDGSLRLAIVDWLMPGLDGLELCRRVRRSDAHRSIYIIMLTAKGEVEDLVQAMDAGADDFTVKSFDVRELKVRLRAGERIVQLEESLRHMATRDALTEIWNRGAILEALERELSRAQRKPADVGIIMCDVDHFKRVNDVYGHAGGDAVLVEIAQRLQGGLRQYDVVGRYGGEEFLAVLPGATAQETADVAERLRLAVGQVPIRLARDLITVTASFGTAVSAKDQNRIADEMIRLADAALYRAKDAGRNRVEATGLYGSGRPDQDDPAPPREGLSPAAREAVGVCQGPSAPHASRVSEP